MKTIKTNQFVSTSRRISSTSKVIPLFFLLLCKFSYAACPTYAQDCPTCNNFTLSVAVTSGNPGQIGQQSGFTASPDMSQLAPGCPTSVSYSWSGCVSGSQRTVYFTPTAPGPFKATCAVTVNGTSKSDSATLTVNGTLGGTIGLPFGANVRAADITSSLGQYFLGVSGVLSVIKDEANTAVDAAAAAAGETPLQFLGTHTIDAMASYVQTQVSNGAAGIQTAINNAISTAAQSIATGIDNTQNGPVAVVSGTFSYGGNAPGWGTPSVSMRGTTQLNGNGSISYQNSVNATPMGVGATVNVTFNATLQGSATCTAINPVIASPANSSSGASAVPNVSVTVSGSVGGGVGLTATAGGGVTYVKQLSPVSGTIVAGQYN